ncbi:MAG: S8 family serine peptidase [Thermoleophilia bacterium]|nr:S8 family serine peptidase [Thermoleophilia bacterium]
MRTPRRASGAPALARAGLLALVALAAALLALAGPVRGAGDGVRESALAAWNAVFGERPAPAGGQRMIVVLRAPSLADQMAAAETEPTSEDERRWVAEADAGQRVLLQQLADRGLTLRRERVFTKTLNGFSAVVDARAQAELERRGEVAGVYPVRTVYPASIASRALTGPEFRAGAGRRPEGGLPGFDGSGITIALLDSGVDLEHPYLNGRVLRGVDLVDRDGRAIAERKPDDPTRVESHGTRMAGILVGAGGPGRLGGIAPGARVLPLRVLGWERSADGTWALLGRGDVLLAGFERAVDPDGDGDVGDRAAVTLAPVVEPYASVPDSPEARAVAGATRLGTLVVAPAGNDGRGARAFGTVGAPGGAPSALTAGALDTRRETLAARTVVRAGGNVVVDDAAPLVGAVRPRGELPVTALLGPSLADPSRRREVAADGSALADLFDPAGVSRVAGRAVIVSGASRSLETKVRNAATAGAAAVLVHGGPILAGSLDLDETTAVPVVALAADAAHAALDALVRGEPVSIAFRGVRAGTNAGVGRVAVFSSGGVAFGGHVKPDVLAAGVGLATADAGATADGSPRYATATGSSVAAAVTAASAAVLVQARPGLSVGELRSLLVGTAVQLVREGRPDPVTVQGAGVVDPGAAAAAEVAVEPMTLAFGRAGGDGWQVTQTVTLRNLSRRRLEIGLGITRDTWGKPDLSFSASPANVSLAPGASAPVVLVVSGAAPLSGAAGGSFVVSPAGSRPLRVPWAVSFRSGRPEPLLAAVALSHERFRASDAAPVVLAFRVGRVAESEAGRSVEPVQLLVAELWADGGRKLGVLTRLHDLLPGRYALGLTGRGPRGNELRRGRYVLRLLAYPVAGDAGAEATTVDVPFTILGKR